MKLIVFTIVLGLLAMGLSGCIPGDGKHTRDKPAGVFWGIWHGWIAPFSLVVGIFNKSIRIYEKNNRGWLYDFGYYMAIIGGFGGLSLIRRRRD